MPLDGRRPGAGPRLGPRRAAGRRCPGSGRRSRACAAATRPRTSRSPTRCSTRSRRRASPRSRPTPAGAATRRRAGRAGSSSSTSPRRRAREVLLDGAHNPDGAAALAQALDDLRPYLAGGRADPPRPPVLVWASMADKDVAAIVARDRGQPGARGRDRRVHGPRRAPRAARRRARGRLAGGAARARPCASRSPTRDRRSTSRWRPATARSSSPGRCTSSARRGRGWSTIRCCATRWRHDAATSRRWRRAWSRRVRRPAAARRRRRSGCPPARPTGVPGAPGATVIGPATFAWGERTYVMGVLNVTPDSFSGDGLLAGGRPGRGRGGPGAPDGRRGRRPPRRRRRLDAGPATTPVDAAEEAARVDPGGPRRRGGAARRRRSRSTRRARPSPRPRSTPAPTSLNDVWGVADDPAMVRLAAGARRADRR